MFFCASMSSSVYLQYPLHRRGQINWWVAAEPWLEAGTAEPQNPFLKYAEPWPGSLLLRPPEHWALTLWCFSSDSSQQLSWASAHLSVCAHLLPSTPWGRPWTSPPLPSKAGSVWAGGHGRASHKPELAVAPCCQKLPCGCFITLKPQHEGHNTWFCCSLELPMALWPEEITIQESSRVLGLTLTVLCLFSFLYKCHGFLFRAAEQGNSGGVDWLESAGWKGWLAVVWWHSAQLP